MSPTPSQPTASVDQVRQLLRHRHDLMKLQESPWLTSEIVRQKQKVYPHLTPVAALLALLDDTLAAFQRAEPALADLLHGRFWENLSINAMLAQERPEPQSIRRFHQQQERALHAFAQRLAQYVCIAQQQIATEQLQHHLPMPTYDELFGVGAVAAQLCSYLHEQEQHPILSIKGIGGIGKTALADFVLRQHLQGQQITGDPLVQEHQWQDIIWISAKQEFLTHSGVQGTQPRIQLDTLFDELGHKLHLADVSRLPMAQKVERIGTVLRAQPHLVVFDNLESVEDFRQLVPWLTQVARPSQFILTARVTFPALTEVTVIDLDEMDQRAAHALIQHTAQKRAVQDCDPAAIYRLVGGNPLAIILVVSQMALLPMDRVLTGIQSGTTKHLYTYIYRQAWSLLDQAAQDLLFAIHRVGGEADYGWLAMATDLASVSLDEQLRKLYDLSLIQHQRNMTGQPTYTIHRLTSTFLQTEVLGWR
ncbi:MAG: NB-ARC domain-containing protein [Caldilineaceae bacterium]